MNCPHCGKPISSKLAAKALRSIESESRAKASKENGKKGGAPIQPRCWICNKIERAHRNYSHKFAPTPLG